MRIESVIPEASFYQQVNKFTLSLPLAETIQETIARLEYILKKYQGNIPVVLSIETPISKDPNSDIDEVLNLGEEESEFVNPVQAIEFKSLAYKVKITDELINDLHDIVTLDKVKLAV